MALTETQKKQYVHSEGNKCPYCGSDEIEGTGCSDSDGNWHAERVVCNDCQTTWQDLYTLTDIVEEDS